MKSEDLLIVMVNHYTIIPHHRSKHGRLVRPIFFSLQSIENVVLDQIPLTALKAPITLGFAESCRIMVPRS